MEADLITYLVNTNRSHLYHFPDKQQAEQFIERMFRFLFINTNATSASIQEDHESLKHQFASLVIEREESAEHTQSFFNAVPSIYKALLEDANAILEFDPAAKHLSEVIIAYPGFYATVVYRLSHQLWLQGLRILPRLFSEFAHSKTGIDIHPGASIGCGFAIDHGTGIVIGETSVVGNYVKIYQGVTLGALNVDKAYAQIKRHPTIEDKVVIYSNATILGGNTIVGEGSILGGNVWLTQSVPPNSIVYHKSEIKIKDKDPFAEPLNFII